LSAGSTGGSTTADGDAGGRRGEGSTGTSSGCGSTVLSASIHIGIDTTYEVVERAEALTEEPS
jgi:hypothetical protein